MKRIVVGGTLALVFVLTFLVFLPEIGLDEPQPKPELSVNETQSDPNTPVNETQSDLGLPFETIVQGYYGGITIRANYTIQDLDTWEDTWARIYSNRWHIPPLPALNFSTDLVVAVFQGECPSGGYKTNITKINSTDTHYYVYIDEFHAISGGTYALTYPYHIVKLSNYPFGRSVQFIYTIIER